MQKNINTDGTCEMLHQHKQNVATHAVGLKWIMLVNSQTYMHPGGKPYRCQLCQKTFAEGCNLKRHMKTHSEEKPYKCQLCHKLFAHSGHLKRHMITHTGEKPHKCQLCQKSFALGGPLKDHMKTHSGEKPYKCELCHESYAIWQYSKITHENPYWGEASQMSVMSEIICSK